MKLYRADIASREDAHALIFRAAEEICGVQNPKICYTDAGKPYFADLPIHFSLSHSGTKAILAVAECEVGADIQEMKEVNLRLAERVFTPREREYVGGDPVRFFEIWTKKEAYGKWKGSGVASVFRTDILDMDFYTEQDGEYMIAVYAK